ncbi:MAG: hypothetical protein NTX53_20775 [candidate division WOR-3 bacterium]|nr:hypothetical protein [candidate division WOR-3 bacterium]
MKDSSCRISVRTPFPSVSALVLCVLSTIAVSTAQSWMFTYPGVYSFSGALDNADRMCFAGTIEGIPEDISAVGLDTGGGVRWTLTWGSPWGWRDICWGAASDSWGNFYVVGESRVDDTSRCYMVTLAIDTSGNIKWVRYYIEPDSTWGSAYAVCTDPRGKVYVTGKSGSGTLGPYWMTTLCYDTSGMLDWFADYRGPNDRWNRPWDIVADDRSNVYITGQSDNLQGYHDYATIKYDSTGREEWSARYNDPNRDHENAVGIAVDDEYNVLVTGTSDNGSDAQWATVKYDSAGQELWVRTRRGTGQGLNIATALTVDKKGNVFVGGAVSTDSGVSLATVKYRPDGDSAWISYCGENGTFGQTTLGIDTDSLGYTYTAGNYSHGSQDVRWIMTQIDTAGSIGWSAAYVPPVYSEPSILLLDNEGCIYVGGYYWGGGGIGQVVLKYPNPNVGVAEGSSPAGGEKRSAGTVVGRSFGQTAQGDVLDINGRRVAKLHRGEGISFQPGPGIYFLRDRSTTQKLVVVR